MKPEMCWEDYVISLFLMQLLYLVGVLLMTFNLLTCVHSQSMSLTLLYNWVRDLRTFVSVRIYIQHFSVD